MPNALRKVAVVRCSMGATDDGAKVAPWAAVSPADIKREWERVLLLEEAYRHG